MVVPRRLLQVHGRAYLNLPGTEPQPDPAEFAAADTIQVRNRVACVKCDVEGAELHVLHGGQAALDRERPSLLIEMEPRHRRKYATNATQAFTWLRRRGYTPHAWGAGTLHSVDVPIAPSATTCSGQQWP